TPSFVPLLLLLWPPLPLALGHSLRSTSSSSSPQISTSLHDSRLNHLLLDPTSSSIYVGAVNALYHLSPDLQLLSWGKTGPKLDSPDCLPPIDPLDCTQAKYTDNTNKLLLLEEQDAGGGPRSLIVCGTVLQGICEKRSLRNVSEVLYQTANPVDTQYVAANDPRVSTVGVIVEQKGVGLMLVGRGYTSKGPGGIPPITARRLAPHLSAPAFSHEELGKLVVGSYSEYNNQFVKALHHDKHIYFLFSRRNVWGNREYRTYVSRLCAGDPSFYSYVEVPLECNGGNNLVYNLAQSAALGNHRGEPALFVAMSVGQASTPTPTSRSALCVYSMKDLNQALKKAQLLCYTQEGKGTGTNDAYDAYIEYEVSSRCLKLPSDSVDEYPCGGEHTPSPIASALPLHATPAITRTTQVTAVAVATEAGHTIAFLGDKSGQLHKVFLHANGTGALYDSVEVDGQSPVNADLLLDSSGRNIYALTERKVTRLPVAQCERHLDCYSCLSVRDPYCGWCSLEGRWASSFRFTNLNTNFNIFYLKFTRYRPTQSSTYRVHPLTGPLEGGILLTIRGSNLGQHYQDIQAGVTVAGVTCRPLPEAYLISTQIVCELQPAAQVTAGSVVVTVGDSESGHSPQTFTYQDPQLTRIVPNKGPMAGGTRITVHGSQLLTGQGTDLRAFVGSQPCHIMDGVSDTQLVCRTSHSNQTAGVSVRVLFGRAERTVHNVVFRYLEDPVITDATPAESFYGGGRNITVTGQNLDVVQQPMMSILFEMAGNGLVRKRRYSHVSARNVLFNSSMETVDSEQMSCQSPPVPRGCRVVRVWFEMDNVHVDFESIKGTPFTYQPDPELYQLNREDPGNPIRFKPGGVLAVEGKGLTQAMSKEEVAAWLGDKECDVKTLDETHLYCEPPEEQPLSLDHLELPSLKVVMGKLEFNLGTVQYDLGNHSAMPLEAQVGLAASAAVVVLIVLVIILMYRYRNTLNISTFICSLCYIIFLFYISGELSGFSGFSTQGRLLTQLLIGPDARQTPNVRFLILCMFCVQFIHTLEEQQNFSQRDRGYVASLLTMALHDKLEYFTDVMKTLLGDLVQQYVAKNPKLMLRRTETVVEKMLTNWMSICLYSFLKEVAGEPLYMLYRAIKYQVDKGPVDAVTGKAKRTLNDSHLLREDIDYCSITLTVLVKSGMEVQPCPVKVLDTDTITQVKDKILDQIYKGAPFSQRPSADSLDLEWRSGQAGHLTLSDDDVTAIVQGHWKRLNTLQHYKVRHISPVGALIIRGNSGLCFIVVTTETPMLEGGEDEGLRLWHLIKSSEEPEIPKHRKSSMRERERAKAIPEIYLTRLLSMKGTLQKFVDDVFVAILSTKRPPPIAVRFFFDFLDDMAEKHGIDDPETVHIWKTNSLPLRFWVNILKNPQFVFDVQVMDSVDAVLSVIAQTFIDSCTTSEHKVGRDSPVNKLLYAREIPRYKQLVERYYSDIHSAASGCYQEMNSMLTELSGSFASEMNSLVALHELYKYINKYYDQIIMALEEDAAGQKMQLAYRLQQVAALVENKVTDL
uniref:Plexin B3 n=1 Tax=Astyanax mexicanus TaxID=7994 RepID=A0A8B9L9B5_ASTMX